MADKLPRVSAKLVELEVPLEPLTVSMCIYVTTGVSVCDYLHLHVLWRVAR